MAGNEAVDDRIEAPARVAVRERAKNERRAMRSLLSSLTSLSWRRLSFVGVVGVALLARRGVDVDACWNDAAHGSRERTKSAFLFMVR